MKNINPESATHSANLHFPVNMYIIVGFFWLYIQNLLRNSYYYIFIYLFNECHYKNRDKREEGRLVKRVKKVAHPGYSVIFYSSIIAAF